MPELPEVEAVAQTLRPFVEGRSIRCVHVLHAIATKPQDPSQIARLSEGQRIESVERKGKVSLAETGARNHHAPLQARWPTALVFERQEDVRSRKPKGTGVHVDVAFELTMAFLASPTAATSAESSSMNPRKTVPPWRAWAWTPSRPNSPRLVSSKCSPPHVVPERIPPRSIPRRRHRQHLLLRIPLARQTPPAPPRKLPEGRRSSPPPQSDCFCSCACLRMLSASATRFSRCQLVVSGPGKNSSRLRPRRKAMPPLRK